MASHTDSKPSLLILCFTKLVDDARVLKQVEMLKDDYDITTCGYGPATMPGTKHVRIPDEVHSKPSGKLITFKQHLLAYWATPSVRGVLKNFRKGQFDIILANDLEAVPVALRLEPALGVHADLHEYSPALFEDRDWWVRRIYPMMDILCRRYLHQAATHTTTSEGFGRKYLETYGIETTIVPNAAPYRDAEPTPVHDPIRLVHAGVCLRDRHIETMIEGVNQADSNFTFDLYLMPNDPAYLNELKDLTATSTTVNVHDGVPYFELLDTLAQYDVGVHLLYPASFNNKWALPNKLFQNVQARLGMISGPNPEMIPFIEDYGFGTVTDGYEAEDLARVLKGLTPSTVQDWKNAANEAAGPLASEVLCVGWAQALQRLRENAGA